MKVESPGDTLVSLSLRAAVRSQSGYYPFGMSQPGGSYLAQGAQGYRYGFNGKELDKDLSNNYDYGARIYDSRVGRWLSTDPLQVKYPSLSPYHALDNNPILVVDEEGRYNTIYLIVAKDKNGKPQMKPKEAKAIAEQANKYFEDMGLPTRVVYFDESTRGVFNVENIDFTDNVAVIGESPKAVVNTVREQISPMWADRVSSGEFMDESPNASNPEVTNTRWDYQNTTEGNRLGIAIRTDQALDNFRKEFDNKESEINTSAILMVHAAGHNTTPINKAQNNSGEYGHLNSGVMADGNSVAGQIRTGGTSYLMDKKRSDNQFFVDAIIKRYGAGKQKDNYDDNKSKINNGTKKPAYTKR